VPGVVAPGPVSPPAPGSDPSAPGAPVTPAAPAAPVVAEGVRVAIERETRVAPKKKSGKDDDKAVAKGAKDAGRVTWVELGAVPVDPATGSYTLQVGHDVAGNFKYRTVLIGADGSRQVFGEPIAVNVAKAGG